METSVGQQRPGGRAAKVRAAALAATMELLTEVGYEKLSLDEVATRAGVHKTTIWRRWPTKAKLVADAAQLRGEQHVPIPNTGSLGGDLRELAQAVVANIGSETGGQMSKSIIAAAATSPELTHELHTFWAKRFDLTKPIIENAVARGEVAESTDASLVIATLIGPLWARLLLTGEPLTSDIAAQVAAIVTAGVLAENSPN